MSERKSIYIDAMGGDEAPRVNVLGAVRALKYCKENLILVGKKDKISTLLEKASHYLSSAEKARLHVEHAEEYIGMNEHASSAVKAKKNASINVAMKKLISDSHGAFVSAGHSGAILTASILHLKRIPGVERPAIAVSMPAATGRFLLVDGGANTQCRSSQMVQFALLGSTYSKHCLPNNKGSVGILSNGTEESKGNQLTFETHEIMKKIVSDGLFPSKEYLGFVEGKSIFDGKVNVVVCDGFTGNILLKGLEGFSSILNTMIRRELKRNLVSLIGGILTRKAFDRVQSQLDYQEVGAAPLLGLGGKVFVAHGSSTARAMQNAILQASKSLTEALSDALSKVIEETKPYLSKGS